MNTCFIRDYEFKLHCLFIFFGFDTICLSKEIKPRKFDVYY